MRHSKWIETFQITLSSGTCELETFFGYFVISQWARVISSFSWEIKWLGVTITSVNRCEYFVILVFTDWFRLCLQWTYMINEILTKNPDYKKVYFRACVHFHDHPLLTWLSQADSPMKLGIHSMFCSGLLRVRPGKMLTEYEWVRGTTVLVEARW